MKTEIEKQNVCVKVHYIIMYNSKKRSRFHLRTNDPARGKVGRVTDCGVRGLGFKSPGSSLTSRTETSSLSRVVRDGWDPSSVPVSG